MQSDEEIYQWFSMTITTFLIATLAPFQWTMSFAIIRFLIRDTYWTCYKTVGSLLAVFVVLPYLLPSLTPILMHMGSIWGRVMWLYTNRVLQYLASYWICRAVWVMFTWVVIPSFMYLVIPFGLPLFMRSQFEWFRMVMKRCHFSFIETIDGRISNLAYKFEQEKQTLKTEFEFKKNELDAKIKYYWEENTKLEESHSQKTKELRTEHVNRTKPMSDEIELLKAKLNEAQRLSAEHVNAKQALIQEHTQSKARLNAQLNELKEKLRILNLQRHSDNDAYLRWMRETDAKALDLTNMIESTEALLRKLTSKMQPNEIGPALAILEAKLDDRENKMEQMARQMEVKNQALREMKETLKDMQSLLATKEAQLKAKEAELKKANEFNSKAEENKADEIPKETERGCLLNKCDKQMLFKLSQLEEFTRIIRSRNFADYVKVHMTLDTNQQLMFPWMLSVVKDESVYHYITYTFGNKHHLVSNVIKLLLGDDKQCNRANAIKASRLLHPDKNHVNLGVPPWLGKLRVMMFNVLMAQLNEIF